MSSKSILTKPNFVSKSFAIVVFPEKEIPQKIYNLFIIEVYHLNLLCMD